RSATSYTRRSQRYGEPRSSSSRTPARTRLRQPRGGATDRQLGQSTAGSGVLRETAQVFCGKPRFMPPWLGSSHLLVTTLPRVKKWTPSVPCAWLSPKSEFFQPPNE